MDTISFIDYCLFIVSEFLFLNGPFVFYDFNHVFFMKFAVLYHTSVLCIDHHTCFVRNKDVQSIIREMVSWINTHSHILQER